MTASSRSPTLRSRSLPSSICFLSILASSRYRRISASASSRPSMARLSAASAVLRSSCLDCMASELNWLIFSWTELSRREPPSGRVRCSRCCWTVTKTEESRCALCDTGWSGLEPPPAGLDGRDMDGQVAMWCYCLMQCNMFFEVLVRCRQPASWPDFLCTRQAAGFNAPAAEPTENRAGMCAIMQATLVLESGAAWCAMRRCATRSTI